VGLSLIVAIKLHAEVEDPVAPAAPEVIAKAQPATAAEEAPEDKDSPVVVPPVSHFAKLWTNSLFTSRALPPPEAPAGPNFTDSLALSGTYEENGKLTAVLIDKTTSSVVLAYIGEDNTEGFRIVKVTPGASPDQMKLQLQKGSQFGWVTFGADAMGEAPPTAPAANSPLGTRNAVPSPGPRNVGRANLGGARNLPPVPQPAAVAQPVMPPPTQAPLSNLRAGMPQAAPAVPNDIPLPPP